MTMAIVLMVVGLGFVLAEVFFPSMGLLGLIAGVCILGADMVAFRESDSVGYIFVAAEIVLIPTVVWLGFKALPHLSFGRRMMLAPSGGDSGAGLPDLAPLVGKTGEALTPLRPGGMAHIGERRISVVSVEGLLEAGTSLIVVDVEGAEVRVRQAASK